MPLRFGENWILMGSVHMVPTVLGCSVCVCETGFKHPVCPRTVLPNLQYSRRFKRAPGWKYETLHTIYIGKVMDTQRCWKLCPESLFSTEIPLTNLFSWSKNIKLWLNERSLQCSAVSDYPHSYSLKRIFDSASSWSLNWGARRKLY
jgi:hypothetical protein